MRHFLIILIFLFPVIAQAQLSAPGANAVRYTSYPSAPSVKDPVFIFCNADGTQKGTLEADSPGGNGPFDYTWYKWSDATKSFSISLKTETGVTSSTLTNPGEGGYKVVISGGYDTSLVGWIFLDKPYASAALQNRTCEYVALKGSAAIDTFYYNDIASGIPVKLHDGYTFLWSSTPSSAIPYPDLYLNPQTFDPPLVDVTYNLQVTDSFGCISNSSFFYESIHVKADFTATPVEGSAPLEVTFTNNSVHGSTFRWEFGDDSISKVENPDPHTYFIPGSYTVKLTVVSPLSCTDTYTYSSIVVDPSEVGIPNAFTPNGDGINDRFMIEFKSLKLLDVNVYSQSGLKVYSFHGEGERLKDWQGWDGTINLTAAKAAPGIYFYVVKAFGWDNKKYNGKEYRGFVYLYR